jgi:hypothetical protein
MNIINIHKDSLNTMWQNNETFLCVFDEDNKLIADYDFCTGLKLIQNETEMTIYIDNSDLVPGRWVLFATKVLENNNELIKEKIEVEGIKSGNPVPRTFSEEYPWSVNCGPGNHVSRKEREERLDICKSCPLFDLEKMICTVDQKKVLHSTKFENSYCPENKWGDMKKVFAEASGKPSDIIMPIGTQIDPEEQENFEAELEEFLEGLQ